jgi:UrcA family protein
MRTLSSRVMLTTVLGAALSVAGVGIIPTTSALAQTSVEELTVTGHYGPDGAQSLSQPVSFADLDLSSSDGRNEFKHRISLTARYLCEKLGENETSDGVTPSCRDSAVSDAMAQAGPIIKAFQRAQWAAGPAWSPPYPTAWEKTYPDSPYQ